jgi:hypothetical protein
MQIIRGREAAPCDHLIEILCELAEVNDTTREAVLNLRRNPRSGVSPRLPPDLIRGPPGGQALVGQ